MVRTENATSSALTGPLMVALPAKLRDAPFLISRNTLLGTVVASATVTAPALEGITRAVFVLPIVVKAAAKVAYPGAPKIGVPAIKV